jgi:hypothetical protein
LDYHSGFGLVDAVLLPVRSDDHFQEDYSAGQLGDDDQAGPVRWLVDELCRRPEDYSVDQLDDADFLVWSQAQLGDDDQVGRDRWLEEWLNHRLEDYSADQLEWSELGDDDQAGLVQ